MSLPTISVRSLKGREIVLGIALALVTSVCATAATFPPLTQPAAGNDRAELYFDQRCAALYLSLAAASSAGASAKTKRAEAQLGARLELYLGRTETVLRRLGKPATEKAAMKDISTLAYTYDYQIVLGYKTNGKVLSGIVGSDYGYCEGA